MIEDWQSVGDIVLIAYVSGSGRFAKLSIEMAVSKPVMAA